MSLDEHKVQNVNLKPSISEKIKSIGSSISNHFRNNKKFKYAIQSTDGSIWNNLKLNKLTSLYSATNDKYILYYEEQKDNEILYHNLIDNTYATTKEFISMILGTNNGVDIDRYVSNEDIMFARVLPTIDGKNLKEKVEKDFRKLHNDVLTKRLK